MDLQGAAIEDLGEAGTHLGKKQVADEGPVGMPRQRGLGMPSEHLRAPWGWEEGHDRMISA